MKVIESIFLGALQGLTEFLPVSSSGHLVLFQNIFKTSGNVIFFDCILHLGTLLAVIIMYRKTIFKILKKPFCPLTYKLILATVPTVVIGIVFNDFFESTFSGEYLFVGFIVSAIFLFFAEYSQKRNNSPTSMTYFKAFIVGIFQGVAIMPGISRSGTTISTSIIQGVEKEEATEFCFLLSMPVILGSTILEFFKLIGGVSTSPVAFECYIAGGFMSFIFGILSIKFMISTIKKNKYCIFSIYLILLAIVLIINKITPFLF